MAQRLWACDPLEARYALIGTLSKERGRCSAWSAVSIGTSAPIEAVAVKLLSREQAAHKEVSMLLEAQGHPNVLRLHGVFWAPECMCDEQDSNENTSETSTLRRKAMVTDFCEGGNLLQDIYDAGAYDWPDAARLCGSLTLALAHVHSLGIIHRDVQPANVLLRGDGEAVLAGFRVAVQGSDELELQQRCGAPGYAAPEVILGRGCCAASDMFSAGCTIFYALSGTGSPFSGKTPAIAIRNAVYQQVRFTGSHQIESLSLQGQALLRGFLEKEPKRRFTAEQALEHPWLQKMMGE